MDQETIVRAATFPVAEPVGATWKELDAALLTAWRDATDLSNWAVTELAKADVQRKPRSGAAKKQKKIDLYNKGFTNKGFWGFAAWKECTQSASTIMRKVEKVYRKTRRDIWDGKRVLPTFRYPQPYPVHNARWSALYVDGKPAVRFNLAGRSWTIRLKSGAEFKRQLAMFRLIESGEAPQCELAIYRQGFREKHVMVKLVAWFPKPPAKEGRTMLVRTDPHALWVAELEGRPPWILNADHVRRWIESHRVYLQRIGEDTKHEKRWPAQMRRNINKARELRCEKQNNRLDSWTHEATAMLANFAQRNGVAEMIYDDSCKEYIERFPWHSLKTKLAYKLEAAGIVFMCDTREAANV